jgi:hypothetical protein
MFIGLFEDPVSLADIGGGEDFSKGRESSPDGLDCELSKVKEPRS